MLVSFLIGRRLKGFVHALAAEGVQLLICAELLNELRDVLTRPAMRKYFTVE